MNKTWNKILLFIILTILLCLFFDVNKKIKVENDDLLLFFINEGVVDASNKINFSSIKAKRDFLLKEIEDVYDSDDITEISETINVFNEENGEKKAEVLKLTAEIHQLEEQKDSLMAEHQVLNTKYQQKLAEEQKEKERIKNNTIIISGVPTINQYPKYPTGCESVALTILLNYYGVNISADDVINKLKKEPLPYEENGITYGGNPDIGFIGNPYNADSFGVYNRPIADVANMFKEGVIVRNNVPLSEVLELVNIGRPVIVWTSMNLALPYVSRTWIYKPTGATIEWKAQEHAVVIIGYNNDNVIISDPLRGSTRYQSRSLFETRYNYYGRMVVYY